MGRVEEPPSRVHQLECVECGCLSGLYAAGWRAYRVADPDVNDVPVLTFYCPTCAAREFSTD